MSLKEWFLSKSNSYIYYKSNFEKLKKQNDGLKERNANLKGSIKSLEDKIGNIERQNNDLKDNLQTAERNKEYYFNKKAKAEKKLAKNVKPQILEKIINGKYNELNIAIKSPNPTNDKRWGDYFFAQGLKRSLEKKGFNVVIQEREYWYEDTDADINIIIRGLIEYDVNYDEINLMWNISHPNKINYDDYEKYDMVFIASENYAKTLENRLNTQVETLYQCTDPNIFFTEKEDDLYEDILFVGMARGVYREIVKDSIRKGFDINIYGVGWKKFIDEKFIKGGFIPNDELHKYYSSCRILLNDHWEDMKELDFPSNRLFDALACGTFIISDDVPSVESLFEGNVVTYKNADDLEEKINYYLKNPRECEEMALKGKEIVLKNHTFDNRVEDLLYYLKQLKLDKN